MLRRWVKVSAHVGLFLVALAVFYLGLRSGTELEPARWELS